VVVDFVVVLLVFMMGEVVVRVVFFMFVNLDVVIDSFDSCC